MSEEVKVSVKNLTKSFGDLLVLDDITSVMGFLSMA